MEKEVILNRLYLCSENHEQYVDLLEKACLPDITLTTNIEDANVVLADPPRIAPHIEQAQKLIWLQSTFAGCDALLANPKRDYQLTNVRGVFGPLMSEYVFGQLLSVTRHLREYHTQQTEHHWSPIPYGSLQGKQMVILGTGSIGAHVATTAKHFGMKVTGVSRRGAPTEPFDDVVSNADLRHALASADVIVSTLPSTPQTKHLLNAESLSHCHQALLFNVGRGPVLEEQGLLTAIENQHIKHAFLDVFATEPLGSEHPFWAHPAISVTPHISAISFPEQVVTIFKENYLRWREGQPLQHIVDFESGY
ncbi:D-2-hydroxyacid dehydrogenase [Enterovibrio calviensis]|uniref:D-2-hydroxyacid dehydrogenase n=1 Tax=Enterovibrio calviensis TaxID=91359 RepID=UPI0004865D33|nr:D-2-hydroxyacid dehydrogenase [Enterovibrio calviensis]